MAYGIPLHQRWYKQTVSHNTLVVDGQSQAECTGRLDLLVNGSDFDLVSASADEAYKGVRMSRTLLFMQDLVLVIDRLAGRQRHTFDWVYHNRGEMRTEFRRRRRKTALDEGEGYEVIEDLRRGQPEASWRAVWRTEGAGVRLTMLESRQPTEVFTGLGMDSTRAGAVKEASRARGVTLLRGKTRLTLIAALRSGRILWEGLTFEGRALFVDTSNRRPDRVVLAGGRRLTWEDRTWRVHPDGSVQFERMEGRMRLTNLGTVEVDVEGRTAALAPGQRWVVPF